MARWSHWPMVHYFFLLFLLKPAYKHWKNCMNERTKEQSERKKISNMEISASLSQFHPLTLCAQRYSKFKKKTKKKHLTLDIRQLPLHMPQGDLSIKKERKGIMATGANECFSRIYRGQNWFLNDCNECYATNKISFECIIRPKSKRKTEKTWKVGVGEL